MEEYIEEFKKIIIDFENIDVNIDDEGQALLLVRYLPSTYKHLTDTLVYIW